MTQPEAPAPSPIPTATYRLQLNRAFPFSAAAELAPYLCALGASHVYASPILRARSGSGHGYDGVDPTRISPELGGDAGFAAWSRALHAHGLGLLLDIVPNHLCVVGGENAWWQDVLTHGRGSPHAAVFDIDWQPPDPALAGRVLLPLLGGPLDAILAAGELQVVCEPGLAHVPRGHAFALAYHEHRWPLCPHSWPLLLEPAAADAALPPAAHRELRALVAMAQRFRAPHATARPLSARRLAGFATLCERLGAALARHAPVAAALAAACDAWHAAARRPEDARWPALLEAQAWRLSDWREAGERLNVRRFFDITELAGVRQEDPRVFAATHARVLALVAGGAVQGLRIDHPDGLADPGGYLRRLRRAVLQAGGGQHGRHDGGAYVVVEKILEPSERRRGDWPVEGGTGYDMLYRLNAVQVDEALAADFRAAYVRCTGDGHAFAEHVAAGKRLVLETSLAGDLARLARQLGALAANTAQWQAVPPPTWQAALAALAVALPVYRTYVTGGRRGSADDAQWLAAALVEARRAQGDLDPALLGWLCDLLLDPAGTLPGADARTRRAAQAFVTRFQQLTGATMAKGLEDTAYYRYVPLVSLNEVGGDPGAFGGAVGAFGGAPAAFHGWNERRARRWPHALSATATHDTKRGEDVRARINALSELPRAWEAAFGRWQAINAHHRAAVDGTAVPEPGTEYLLYQTLVGAWPLDGRRDPEWAGFADRIAAYLEKAVREAKRHTSWTAPNTAYEAGVRAFVHAILADAPGNAFPADVEAFLPPVVRAGLANSLSQTVLKLALPGVPDVYQGTELWQFSLVDPDNRRPVDFAQRRALLAGLPEHPTPAAAEALLAAAPDGRVKLHTLRQGLALRQRRAALFGGRGYVPLEPTGTRARHVLGFSRPHGTRTRGGGTDAVLAVVGRLYLGLPGSGARPDEPVRPPVGPAVWADTRLETVHPLPEGEWCDVLTGRVLRPERHDGRWSIAVAEVLRHLPVALLEHSP